jgi:hypothetical protein
MVMALTLGAVAWRSVSLSALASGINIVVMRRVRSRVIALSDFMVIRLASAQG